MEPRCPRCATPLEPAIQMAQMCPSEHGVFVSGARLPHVLPRKALGILREGPARPGEARCSDCGTAMDRREAFLPVGEMEVDACPRCEGHWFDADELVRVTQATRTTRDRRSSPDRLGQPIGRSDLMHHFLLMLASRE